jgi:hypothetical protein
MEDSMNLRKWLTIGLVLGVVANVLDFIVQGNLLAGYYLQPPFLQENNIGWLVVGDLIAGLVFAWVYLRFAGAVPAGVSGGATIGFYTGVVANFPTWIFMHLLIAGFPYALSWIWTIYGVIYFVVLGAVAGTMNRR